MPTNDNTKVILPPTEFFENALAGEYKEGCVFAVKLLDNSVIYAELKYSEGGSDGTPEGWTLYHGVVPIDPSKVKKIGTGDWVGHLL